MSHVNSLRWPPSKATANVKGGSNDPESSQRVGQNGPLLLQDFHLIDLLAHFDRERIPERVVHAKGAGAYGEFEVLDDISDLVRFNPCLVQMDMYQQMADLV